MKRLTGIKPIFLFLLACALFLKNDALFSKEKNLDASKYKTIHLDKKEINNYFYGLQKLFPNFYNRSSSTTIYFKHLSKGYGNKVKIYNTPLIEISIFSKKNNAYQKKYKLCISLQEIPKKLRNIILEMREKDVSEFIILTSHKNGSYLPQRKSFDKYKIKIVRQYFPPDLPQSIQKLKLFKNTL